MKEPVLLLKVNCRCNGLLICKSSWKKIRKRCRLCWITLLNFIRPKQKIPTNIGWKILRTGASVVNFGGANRFRHGTMQMATVWWPQLRKRHLKNSMVNGQWSMVNWVMRLLSIHHPIAIGSPLMILSKMKTYSTPGLAAGFGQWKFLKASAIRAIKMLLIITPPLLWLPGRISFSFGWQG